MATKGGPEHFVLLNTPFMETGDWIVVDDLPLDTVTVFFEDHASNIRILLHHEPHNIMDRISAFRRPSASDKKCEVTDDSSSQLESDERCYQGELIESILPEHLKAPIIRFMRDTLEGTYYQMHGLFNNTPKLIRTFPITDYNHIIVGGIMIIGAFNAKFDTELQQFVLNTRSAPVPQTMDDEEIEDQSADTKNEKHLKQEQLRQEQEQENLKHEVEALPATNYLGRRNENMKKMRTL